MDPGVSFGRGDYDVGEYPALTIFSKLVIPS